MGPFGGGFGRWGEGGIWLIWAFLWGVGFFGSKSYRKRPVGEGSGLRGGLFCLFLGARGPFLPIFPILGVRGGPFFAYFSYFRVRGGYFLPIFSYLFSNKILKGGPRGVFLPIFSYLFSNKILKGGV